MNENDLMNILLEIKGITTEEAEKCTVQLKNYVNKNFVLKAEYNEIEKRLDIKTKSHEKLEANQEQIKSQLTESIRLEFQKEFDLKLLEAEKKSKIIRVIENNKDHAFKDSKYIDYLIGQLNFNSIEIVNNELSGFKEQYDTFIKENPIFFEKPAQNNNPFRVSGNLPAEGEALNKVVGFGAALAKKHNDSMKATEIVGG